MLATVDPAQCLDTRDPRAGRLSVLRRERSTIASARIDIRPRDVDRDLRINPPRVVHVPGAATSQLEVTDPTIICRDGVGPQREQLAIGDPTVPFDHSCVSAGGTGLDLRLLDPITACVNTCNAARCDCCGLGRPTSRPCATGLELARRPVPRRRRGRTSCNSGRYPPSPPEFRFRFLALGRGPEAAASPPSMRVDRCIANLACRRARVLSPLDQESTHPRDGAVDWGSDCEKRLNATKPIRAIATKPIRTMYLRASVDLEEQSVP